MNPPAARAYAGLSTVVKIWDRAAEDHEPFVHEPVHEGGVLVPPILLTDAARAVPAWTVDVRDDEIAHLGRW